LVPPITQQREIAETLAKQKAIVNEVHAAAKSELNTINALPAALFRRAFNGEM